MKWIDLARAETGHPRGAPFVPHLQAFKRLVDQGRATFPLSVAHYYETGKQHDAQRRIAVTSTMMELSRGLRIAPPHVIVPWETRRAVAEVLGLAVSVPSIQLFGEGAAHAFASPTLRYTAPDQFKGHQLPPEVRAELQRTAGDALEHLLLSATAPEGMPSEARIVLGDYKRSTDEQFVAGQNYVAAELKKLGRHRLDDVLLGTAIADIMSPLEEATRGFGVSLLTDLIDAGRMRELIELMPSRWAEMKLRGMRQANPQKAWHGNDFNDVTALAIAVPYCDVVVTERSWAAMLNDAKIPQRYGTVVTSRLNDVLSMVEE